MIDKFNNSSKVDLRKKTSIKDELDFINLDIQSCMVVLMVIVALLLSVISVVTAHSSII